MEIVPSQMTVANFCQALLRKEIGVNHNYQRSDKVWPPAARSFLIETILLGYPIPKMSLHQVTDVRTRQTRQEIVDGQQRSKAILDFFNNDYRLSRTLELEEAAGKNYEELPEGLQGKFLDYGLSQDLFVAATPAEVREVFRRINSYTVPLNAEEQRHATYQGPFKWFIAQLSKDLGDGLIEIGAFNQKQLVRMLDSKLFTEICHAALNGITTTNKTSLDALYRSRDVTFDEEEEFDERVRSAVDVVISFEELHKTELVKMFQLYSLLLAITHFQSPVAALEELVPPHGRADLDREAAVTNLTALAAAVDADDDEGPFGDFVKASVKATNSRAQRETRFIWMYEALAADLPV
jgi:hypothetical protein